MAGQAQAKRLIELYLCEFSAAFRKIGAESD
jgi:hypothetical protein